MLRIVYFFVCALSKLFLAVQECTCLMKAQLKKCRYEKMQLEKVILYLKDEMQVLSEQLGNLQHILVSFPSCNCDFTVTTNDCVIQSASNTNSMEETAQLNGMLEKLNEENAKLKQKLDNEVKSKQALTARIEKLQKNIAERNNEIKTWEKSMEETKKQLAASLEENQELQKNIAQLKKEIEQFEQETALGEERSQLCQQEISFCQENLCGLKEKLCLMKKLLHKKSEEISKLQFEYDAKCEALSAFKTESEKTKAHYLDDMEDFKHTIRELNDKLTRTEMKYQNLTEEFNMNQCKLVEAAKNENLLQQKLCKYERHMNEKVRNLEKEREEMQKQVAQLEQDLFGMGQELRVKDGQLKNAKMAIQKCKQGGANPQMMTLAQEEIATLKNEMNKMLKVQTQLQNDVSKQCTRLYN